MKNYKASEVRKKLDVNKATFYKYYNSNKKELDKLRVKHKNSFLYTEEFLKRFEKIMNGKTVQKGLEKSEPIQYKSVDKKEEIQTDSNKIFENIQSNLKDFYETRIIEMNSYMKNIEKDKEDYKQQVDKLQNQLIEKDNLLLEKTNKVETLLIGLSKLLNDKQIENKKEELEPEKIFKDVKKNIEETKKEKHQKTDKLKKVETQLESANKQAKEYNKFRKKREQIIERIKEEYNRTKFFQIMKRSKLKKELEREYNKKFEFVHYVV